MDKAAPDPLQAIRDRIDAIDEAMHRLLIERSGRDRGADRDQGHEQARRRVPPGPRGGHDAPSRAPPRRRAAACDGRAHLARDHHHLHDDAGAVLDRRRAGRGCACTARRDPLLFRLLRPDRELRERVGRNRARCAIRQGDRRCPGGMPPSDGGRALPAPASRKIFAKLPFIEIPDRPADLPAYVVGPPLREKPTPDIQRLCLERCR